MTCMIPADGFPKEILYAGPMRAQAREAWIGDGYRWSAAWSAGGECSSEWMAVLYQRRGVSVFVRYRP